MKSILALVLGVSLFVSPLAMAGGLSSTDSGFLFKGDQVSATTISSQEMQSTQGQALVSDTLILLFTNVNPVVNDLMKTAGDTEKALIGITAGLGL
jgi:hypothetical protein